MDGLDRKRWEAARQDCLLRDGNRCTAAEWDHAPCRGDLVVHHIDPETPDPYELDGLLTLCRYHHLALHRLMAENERSLVTRR